MRKPIAISHPGDTARSTNVAGLRDGGAIVTWAIGGTRGRLRVVGLVVDPNGAQRGRPVVLSGPSCGGSLMRVSAADDVTLAWTRQRDAEGDDISIAASGGTAAEPLAPSVDLGRRAYASTDALGLDARGNAVLVYSTDGKTTVTRVRPPGGAFGAPLTVPRPVRGRERVEPGGRLVEAGPRLTLLQFVHRGRSLLRDWTP